MFQHLMNTILADVSEFSRAYLDNVSIFSNSWKDHLVDLDEVLSRLERAGLTVKASKCWLGHQECQYLGHVIREGWTNKCRLGCQECQYLEHVIREGWTNKCRLGHQECQYLGHVIREGWTNKCRLGCQECQYLEHVIREGWTNKCRLGHQECQYLGHVIREGWTNKCWLGCQECQYLGHGIRIGIVQPEQNKIKTVLNFERPKKKKDVRAFLGLASYYWKFIPKFYETAIPLTDATKKDAPDKLQWTSSMEAAFQQLKQQLASDVVLASPNEECLFMLHTDASGVGIAGILSQADDSGDDRPIA